MIRHSAAGYNSHQQDVVNKTFMTLMGIESLTSKNLPGYPSGMDISTWPKDKDTGLTYIRFNWTTPGNKRNTEFLQQIFANIRSMGAQRVPTAKLPLSQISDDDLKNKIKQRFTYIGILPRNASQGDDLASNESSAVSQSRKNAEDNVVRDEHQQS